MTKSEIRKKAVQLLSHVTMLLIVLTAFITAANAQTAAGTVISNQASATYGDGNGNSFSTVSNTVTVTVASVSGLTITPDAGSRASVVAGQTGVLYSLRVTNTGNFADQVRFLANGQSIQVSGAGTVTRAVIDSGTTAGVIDAGDTNILTNPADVLSASIAANGFVDVLVEVSINAGATNGSSVNVQLGDTILGAPSYDNQLATLSAHEVRTVSTASVNGLREARGDVSATVENDAQIQLGVTYPTGPILVGSNITYNWQLCDTGVRAAQAITLSGAPAGSNSGVFIIAPVPVGTSVAVQTFPAGTLFTTSPLTTAPTAATWTTLPPALLSTVTRVAYNVGPTLAAGSCSTAGNYNLVVTVTTTDTTNGIFEIGDAFANNSIGAQITDQSGDLVANAGDGNANFDEGILPGNLDGNGIQVGTLLIRAGGVLIGPNGVSGATGPTSVNDDYTNRSVTTGIAGVPFGENTTASGQIVFTNTIRNTGNANDTFVISRESAPTGLTVEISTDNGATYTTVTTNTVSVPVAILSTANILVRVTAAAGQPVLTAYPVVIRATSTNTPSSYNETIDRLYTGAFLMTKTATVINGTGQGDLNDPVPGAVIRYTIVYTNITSFGGIGSSVITLSNIVITEDGNAAPNNWGTTTTQLVGSGVDTIGGSVTGDSTGSTVLTDTIPLLTPAATGSFTFRRVIN